MLSGRCERMLPETLETLMFLRYNTGWLTKSVPIFPRMLYCSAIELQQKEIKLLKSNYGRTLREIMTLYFLLWQWNTQKSIGCPKRTKSPIRLTGLTAWDRCPVTVSSEKCASILLSNRIQSFFHCAMDFRTVSMVTSFHLFLIASLRSCRFAKGSRVGFRTQNPAGYPRCSNRED